MKIELEVQSVAPLCIAAAIIEYEFLYVSSDFEKINAMESIRQIGKALCECVNSIERIDKWSKE